MGAILNYICYVVTYSKDSYLVKAVILLMITTSTNKMAAPTRTMKVTMATRLPITAPTLTSDSVSSCFTPGVCWDGVRLTWVLMAADVAGGVGGGGGLERMKEGLGVMRGCM